jgi:phosphoinositide-3-kinase, regulatory subunit 4
VSSRRDTLDLTPQSPRSPRLSGLPHLDPPSGSTATQDLRRRLVVTNSSNVSVTSSPAPSPHAVLSLHPPTAVSLSAAAAALEAERPSSPTESVVSTTDSAVRSVHKFHIGTGDSGKAAPAVGSSRTTATGLLEAPSLPQVRADDYPASSSRRTSFSASGTPRNKTSPLPLISTYGDSCRFSYSV